MIAPSIQVPNHQGEPSDSCRGPYQHAYGYDEHVFPGGFAGNRVVSGLVGLEGIIRGKEVSK